jgi:hypothetical protein
MIKILSNKIIKIIIMMNIIIFQKKEQYDYNQNNIYVDDYSDFDKIMFRP